MDGYAKGSTEQLQFDIGSFKYTVSSERAAFDSNGSGVEVRRGDQRIAYHLCDEIAASIVFLWRAYNISAGRSASDGRPLI